MMLETGFKKAIANAEHYVALGQRNVYLSKDDDEYPWEYVTTCDSGSCMRGSVHIGCSFTAPHSCGLTFHWEVEFGPYTANAGALYQFDTDKMREVRDALPEQIRDQFAAYVRDVMGTIEDWAGEYQDALDKITASLRGMKALL